MVHDLLKIAPLFYSRFNKVFDEKTQSDIATNKFNYLSAIWKEEKSKSIKLEKYLDSINPPKKQSKKYFETNRSFFNLVPKFYKRTDAPRISTLGSTFHGMKKVLLIEILKELSLMKSAVFIDVDMSAAHTRIARYLLSDSQSDLERSLVDNDFWQKQILLYKPYCEGLNLDDKTIKKILKVGLYTSLNGGNPYSDKQLVANISLNAVQYLETKNLLINPELIQNDSIFSSLKELLKNFKLINEVKNLSSKCFIESYNINNIKEFEVYTVDRVMPYATDSGHKGISRVLQGFEIVLLTTLVYDVLKCNFQILSLDHDGLFIMMTKSQFNESQNDPFKICTLLSKGKLNEFSKYLLNQPIPIEPKRLIIDGTFIEL